MQDHAATLMIQPPLKPLHLNLKAIYFQEISVGSKTHEFRLRTPHWRKRLEGKCFSCILIKSGYPNAHDPSRVLTRPWRGFDVRTICHPHFGSSPVEVFAIRVND